MSGISNFKFKPMNKIYIFSLLIFVFLFSQSCQTIIDIDQKEFQKRLVMSCTLNPDSIINVYVTRSVGPLASGLPLTITDAIVDFYEDGNLLFTIPHDSAGNYSYNFHPVIGKTYTVKAAAPGFEQSIEATTIIPTSAIIDTFSYAIVLNEENNWGSQYGLNGSITINDLPGENYYMIQAYQSSVDTFNSPTQINGYNLYITADDPLIGNSRDYNSSILFSDFSFDGTSYKINFSSDNVDTYSFDVHLQYIVYSLSKESYLYLISLNNYYKSNGNPFAEPVQVYSNVSSGMGILGSASRWEALVY